MKPVHVSPANPVLVVRRHIRVIACVAVVAAGAATMFLDVARAQTHPASQGSKPPARGSSAVTHPHGTAAHGAAEVDANLLQLMRGILYPSSNVIFAAQDDLSKQPSAADPSVSPNPLTSTYGGWQAVENAGLALAESANLIALPGRVCANGKPVPVQRADWVKFTQGLREAGMAAYQAAQSKNSDAIVDVSGQVADACASCHDVYREKKGGLADRCTP